MPIRGLITSSEIDPGDIERAIRRAAELGVELTHDPATDTDELLDVLARHSDIEVILGDFLPNVRGVDTTYAFGSTGGDDAGAAAEQEVLERIPALRWVQLPSVGVNQEHSSVTWRRAPQVAVTNASGLASTAMAQYVTASILYHAHRLWLLPKYGRVRDWSVRSEFRPEILVGRTLGLLGYGGVGRRAAHIAHCSGCGCSRSGASPDDHPLSSSASRRSRHSIPGRSPRRSARWTNWTGCSRRPSSSFRPCP